MAEEKTEEKNEEQEKGKVENENLDLKGADKGFEQEKGKVENENLAGASEKADEKTEKHEESGDGSESKSSEKSGGDRESGEDAEKEGKRLQADQDEPTSGEKGPAKKKDAEKEKPVIKKTETFVNSSNLPVSTKQSVAICRFIKGKGIEEAIEDLEDVLKQRKAVPMKGEIPHRKGKGMMSGRYPEKSTEHFIMLLKSLLANSDNLNVDSPVIAEAVANIGQRPFGRFGRFRRKRTHVRITARTSGGKR